MALDDIQTTAPGVAADTAYTPWPATIGGYRVIRPLGEGGMGVVYLAEQDVPVRREVAIKVLRAGSNSAEIIARFESERQALALMEHPNITRVYEAGTHGGLPYFVMERVRGVPIGDYADEHRLPIAERVRLLAQVCQAVQHAHQKGIIHRDIKPSNVLVTDADGRPACKVIDFGIAKATEPAPDAARLTATGLAIGTPAYMSPEQLSVGAGANVDTRSDIYSLGVLAYELLTGVLPVEPRTDGGWVPPTVYLATDAPPPSVRFGSLAPERRADVAARRHTDTRTLRRALEGDLDAVLLKTLDHDRERRYASASDLARDFEHFLRDEPVAATPPSRTYRLRKFVRRHRAGVASAVTSIALLVAFAITVGLQARRLARAERLAVTRQAQAEDLVGFMLGDLRSRLTPLGRLDVLDAVGDRALAYFAAVPESDLHDGERYRRAQALQQLGQVRTDQGKLPEAAALLSKAVALSERLVRTDSTNATWQLGLGHAHFWAGNVAWARGDVDAALAHFGPFVRIGEQLIARFPDSTAFRRTLANAVSSIGSAREAKGDLAGALDAYRRAVALDDALVRGASNGIDARPDLALAYNTLAVAQRKRGDLRGALASHDAEIALWAGLAARDTGDAEVGRQLANAYAFRSITRLAAGDRAGALDDAQAARARFAALVARDSANTGWRVDLGAQEHAVALDLLAGGDASGALAHADSALVTLGVLGRDAPPRATRVRNAVRVTQARALVALGRASLGVPLARTAVADNERALAAKPGNLDQRRVLGDATLGLGDALALGGDTAGARAAWSRTLALADSTARVTGQLEFRALQANALLELDSAAARPVAIALASTGYRHPLFVARARRHGIALPP